ncbi:tyrosine-protein phosphatase [Haloechinothrix sp. YIM 98757]|uniref:Tyrosine-protein phosphatase n=1 Tax=Haloechinothrix aidingensis TaxID=2752311 RepID=A0A838ABA9_9PSEU|nr:tyrosine-protein phosphatase [Haloechinothrix aidingensis]MBA0126542.1 tyrosine-protein phosphatase [Haloechinothrix aidingensis]
MAPRWVNFASIDNVRDLGGLPAGDGYRTRTGLAFRSSTLQELTDSDLRTWLDRLGLRTVIDLRLPNEVRREGYGLLTGTGVRRINLPIRGENARPDDVVPDSRGTDLTALYAGMLRGSEESIVAAARIIADRDRHAVVFHCAGGKDRTGVLAAVLLDAVGVPAESIVQDYALTGRRLESIRARLVRLPSYERLPAVGTGVLSADPAVMRRFVAMMREKYGGGAEWLVRHGMRESELDRLREALVEPAPTATAPAPR